MSSRKSATAMWSVKFGDHTPKFRDEVFPLMKLALDEAGFGFEFAPDWTSFANAVIGALRRNGELAGVVVARAGSHPFSTSTVVCQSEIIYVLPEYRGSRGAYLLVRWLERWARKCGCTHMVWQVSAKNSFKDALQRRGYDLTDVALIRKFT